MSAGIHVVQIALSDERWMALKVLAALDGSSLRGMIQSHVETVADEFRAENAALLKRAG